MHRLWLLLVLSLLPSQPGYAECACLWRGSFSEVQAKTDLVVSAEVVATKGNSIDPKRVRQADVDVRNALFVKLENYLYYS